VKAGRDGEPEGGTKGKKGRAGWRASRGPAQEFPFACKSIRLAYQKISTPLSNESESLLGAFVTRPPTYSLMGTPVDMKRGTVRKVDNRERRREGSFIGRTAGVVETI